MVKDGVNKSNHPIQKPIIISHEAIITWQYYSTSCLEVNGKAKVHHEDKQSMCSKNRHQKLATIQPYFPVREEANLATCLVKSLP
jgi:hypothetical protein